MKHLKINERFKKACPDLTIEEYNKLEELILKDGVIYNPILIWNDVIIDGHNRYDIAIKNHLEFTTKEVLFDSDDDAIAWIKENAIGQRNLNSYQRSKLVLELEDYYKAKAKERQIRKPESVVPMLAPQSETGKVRDELAEKAGVSHGTLDKVKTIEKEADEETKEQLETGEISINSVFNDIKFSKSKMAPEIDILESASDSLKRWVDKYSDKECCFEFIPTIRDLIVVIKNKKIDYAEIIE